MAIAQHVGRRRIITAAADLWGDLKIEGSDVDELFMHLERECGPLDTTAIRFERHFEMNEPPWSLDWFGKRRRKFERERIPLKVADIESWVTTGQWPIDYSRS